MNTFANATKATVKPGRKTKIKRTANGMRALASSNKPVVDLFYSIGASRGKDVIPAFVSAFNANSDLALRIAAWVRDVRGGAGERETFRNILRHLEISSPEACSALMRKVPELGRWDDLLIVTSERARVQAEEMIKAALEAGNGLCAKWMPRKGPMANQLRNAFGWSPKFYRKRLVELTKVVETQMCSGNWDEINFSHVPSVASSRYKKAFNRHTTKYGEYVAALVKGTDKTVKVNASAIFPHDVLKGQITRYHGMNLDKTELALLEKQWEALPNYVGDKNILPLVDVSGSMVTPCGKNNNLLVIEIAVALGLYLADKNIGKFHGTFLTFSGKPELLSLTGSILKKIEQMTSSHWEMNTNLHAAMDKILSIAIKNKVSQSEMPDMLLILSDMQFDQCVTHDDFAMQMLERKFEDAGYNVPKVVFWNLNGADNVPVKSDKSGAALVSGFSPAICKALLEGNTDQFTPESIMLQTIMKDRYAVL